MELLHRLKLTGRLLWAVGKIRFEVFLILGATLRSILWVLMMVAWVLWLLLVGAARPAHAEGLPLPASDWSRSDTALETGFVLFAALDLAQTHRIAGYCNGRGPGCTVHETNPILGRAPSSAAINRYFAGAMLGQFLVANALPHGATRTLFISGTATLEIVVTGRNARLGLGYHF